MILLVLGVSLLAALHLSQVKSAIVARAGQGGYGAALGAISIVALLLIVTGWRLSDFVSLYEPPVWGRHANFGLSFLAFLCLGIFLFRGRLRQILQFPMGIAVGLWSVGHLLAMATFAVSYYSGAC